MVTPTHRFRHPIPTRRPARKTLFGREALRLRVRAMRIPMSRSIALALIAATALSLGGCAGSRNKKTDLPYVARDVGTLYSMAKKRLDQRPLQGSRAHLRRGRAPASLFDLGAPRAADERVQLLCGGRLHQVDRFGAPLPVDPPRQSRRALCALSDRAQLLRADQRRHPRPGDHPPGAGFARRAGPPLSGHALCRRCAAQDRPRPRSSRRQGDGDRPLLPAPPAMAGGGGPLPHRGRRISDDQPRARSADAADRILSRARRSGGGAARGGGARRQLSRHRLVSARLRADAAPSPPAAAAAAKRSAA